MPCPALPSEPPPCMSPCGQPEPGTGLRHLEGRRGSPASDSVPGLLSPQAAAVIKTQQGGQEVAPGSQRGKECTVRPAPGQPNLRHLLKAEAASEGQTGHRLKGQGPSDCMPAACPRVPSTEADLTANSHFCLRCCCSARFCGAATGSGAPAGPGSCPPTPPPLSSRVLRLLCCCS